MPSADLKARLRSARDADAWIAALAEYFRAHGLVFGHGTDNADDEAYWLLRHLQNWEDVAPHLPPPPALTERAAAIAERRVAERKPLAYLIGEAWFAGLPFAVDERVIVPRSPLAEVIERGFEPWCTLTPGDCVLDIGTGSGCLAIAIAYYCPDVRVVATDVSAAALEVAAANAARHGVADRVELVAADLFPPDEQRFRVIVSNPPYVPEDEVQALPAEYRHEPALALASGPTGFAAVDRILAGAAARLTGDGVLFLEVGAGAEAFAAAHSDFSPIWLEFERGGDGVFVTTADELAAIPSRAPSAHHCR